MPNPTENETESRGKDDKEDGAKDSKPASVSGANRKKRRYIDESRLSESEAAVLEARRAYNRTCAAKARQRSKDLTAQLQEEVAKLKEENANLEHQMEVTRAKMQFLERQNMLLVTSQQQSRPLVSPASLLASQQSGISNTSLGALRGIDQALLSLPGGPYMHSTLGLPGISSINLAQHPSAALGNLGLTLDSINARLSRPNPNSFDKPPPR